MLLGSEISVCTDDENQIHPEVAYDDVNDAYLVVWRYDPPGDDNGDIKGRKVPAGGTGLGPVIDIHVTGTTSQDPALVYDPTGNQFLVVWLDGADTSVDGCLVDLADLDPVGNCFNDLGGSGADRYPDVAVNPDAVSNGTPDENDRFLVVWCRDYDAAMGCFVDAGGDPTGSAFDILDDDTVVYRDRPSVAFEDTDDRYLVVIGREPSGTDRLLSGQRVDEDGDLQGSEIEITTGSDYIGYLRPPGIAVYEEQFYVVWTGRESGSLPRRIRIEVVDPITDFSASATVIFGPEPAKNCWYGPAEIACDSTGSASTATPTSCLVTWGDEVYAGFFFR